MRNENEHQPLWLAHNFMQRRAMLAYLGHLGEAGVGEERRAVDGEVACGCAGQGQVQLAGHTETEHSLPQEA
jgi:hypothetical protein